mmetsp:Transcript_74098/g.192450  ORF Transcript_74098/g.192450 Transcript_74098/m.192450 type:complete len:473 (-) Transcript_74098:1122-2540(-)
MEQGLVRMLPLTRAWMAGQSRRGSRRLEFLPQRLFPAPASPPPRNPMPRRCQPHKHRDLPLMGVQKAMALGHACVHPDLGVRTSRPKETWQGSPHTSSWKHFWYHHSRAPQPALRHSTKQPKTLWKHRNPRCCWYLYPDRWDLWATNAAMEHCLRSCCRVQLPLRPVVHLYCPWLVESLLQELPNCLRRIRLPSGTVAAPNCLYPRQHRPAWMMLASHNPLRLLSCLLRLPPSNRQCPRQHHLTWALTPAPPNPHCQRCQLHGRRRRPLVPMLMQANRLAQYWQPWKRTAQPNQQALWMWLGDSRKLAPSTPTTPQTKRAQSFRYLPQHGYPAAVPMAARRSGLPMGSMWHAHPGGNAERTPRGYLLELCGSNRHVAVRPPFPASLPPLLSNHPWLRMGDEGAMAPSLHPDETWKMLAVSTILHSVRHPSESQLALLPLGSRQSWGQCLQHPLVIAPASTSAPPHLLTLRLS